MPDKHLKKCMESKGKYKEISVWIPASSFGEIEPPKVFSDRVPRKILGWISGEIFERTSGKSPGEIS